MYYVHVDHGGAEGFLLLEELEISDVCSVIKDSVDTT